MRTACPLDCYDACVIEYENDAIKPSKAGYTNGFLCKHLNKYENVETIKQPRYNGVEITLDEALLKLKEIISSTKNSEILHYRGSGNFGLLQGVSDHFFASFGATLTDGSLCDGAGEAGILAGRGVNNNMPLSEIAKSEVVVFWGRNPHATSSHILPLIKGKTIIVIDPVKTQIAKEADLHIQIKPKGDLHLAMLLSRFLYIEDGCDTEFLEEYAPEYEEYYELTQSIRIVAKLKEIDVTLGQIGDFLSLINGKKVAIVCGIGVQKYREGADIIRSIDAFAAMLGLFGKEGCGVSYLANSKDGIEIPFNTKAKKVSKVDTKFENFKTLFIQGANPLSQMPDTNRVEESIKKVQNLIYFGLDENETSKMANLVIPAKSFLYKNDIRTSYSHDLMLEMPKVKECDYGISEYDLSSYLCREFGIEIKSENDYIEHFKKFASKNEDGTLSVKKGKQSIDEFEFLDEIVLDTRILKDRYHLITPKSKSSLNSQFRVDNFVYLNSSLGYKDGDEICVSSDAGIAIFCVKLNDDVRDDCILIYSGAKNLNRLTTSKHSYDGKSAIYQELSVELSKSLDLQKS